jgi:hypothetical protein
MFSTDCVDDWVEVSGALRIVPMSATAQSPAAFNPRQPFSRAQARAAGLTAEMLLSRRFHKICWDTYVAREVPITPLLRATAVSRLVPSGSHISHHTAAELWVQLRQPTALHTSPCRRPVVAWFARESDRTTASIRLRPRSARAYRSRLQSRPSWSWRQSASALSTWSSWPTA